MYLHHVFIMRCAHLFSKLYERLHFALVQIQYCQHCHLLYVSCNHRTVYVILSVNGLAYSYKYLYPWNSVYNTRASKCVSVQTLEIAKQITGLRFRYVNKPPKTEIINLSHRLHSYAQIIKEGYLRFQWFLNMYSVIWFKMCTSEI